MIKQNIDIVNANINKAKIESNNDLARLICVSKTKPIEMLKEAYEAGERHFGENKVQEIVQKSPEMPNDTIWHMIGHLQTNKVKKAVELASYIHSVDSLKLAETINKCAEAINKVQNILCEVNIASEESKYGLNEEGLYELVKQINDMKNVKLVGLMCVAPYTDNPEDNRKYFIKLRNMKDNINNMNLSNISISELSMGMTGDYEVAISEGATFVRVGTGIFGERNYNI